MTKTQQHIFNQEKINRRLGNIQHQINLQGVGKGAYSVLQKRKRPKSKGNVTLLKEMNEQIS